MPKARRIATRDQIVGHEADTPDGIERAIGELVRLTAQPQARARVDADLVVGANRITHNLGRTPQHVTLTPTAADATFAWCVTSRDERQMVITVVGIAQPGASLEVS
jgi:hypothetical protein